MPTYETLQETVVWLDHLNEVYGQQGVVNEVAAVCEENHAYALANHRYRAVLADVAAVIGNLYEETGYERLLDCERDIKRLIQYADSGQLPTQLELFAMPEVEA